MQDLVTNIYARQIKFVVDKNVWFWLSYDKEGIVVFWKHSVCCNNSLVMVIVMLTNLHPCACRSILYCTLLFVI